MVAALNSKERPFSLVVTGEARNWRPVLDLIVGPRWLVTYQARSDREVLDVVQAGAADAAVLDDTAQLGMEALQLLRMIRRLDTCLPVVVVTAVHPERRWLEDALRLAAFSVVPQPLELEELLRQIQRMMLRLNQMLKER